jgi:hypothetical protein
MTQRGMVKACGEGVKASWVRNLRWVVTSSADLMS